MDSTTAAASPAAPPWDFPAGDTPPASTTKARGDADERRPDRARRPQSPPGGAGSPASESPAPAPFAEPLVQLIPLEQLHESPHNPRKHFDPVLLKELGASLRQGQITPCAVRPRKKGGYELAAGHRRLRAAKLEGLPALLCTVQDMSDQRFLEVLTVENLQRDDLHPLEEAQGYASLMKEAGYDVPRIADRVGRSVKYVYDRLKLLTLTATAKQHFLEGRFTAGHAILLARLSAEDQARALDTEDGIGVGRNIMGLYQDEHAGTLFDDEGEEVRDGAGIKAVSVREFDKWISENVRFRRDQLDPVLFPETAAAIQAAEAAPAKPRQRLKVVAITYEHYVRPEARDEDEKTYGPRSWKRADGQPGYDAEAGKVKPSKECEHAVLGVVEVGDGRGQAFRVCIAKDKCQVHWPKAKAKPAREASGASRDTSLQERYRREDEARRAKEEAERARWAKAAPAVLEAVFAHVKKSAAPTVLAKYLCGELNMRGPVTGRTADELLRSMVLVCASDEITDKYSGWRSGPGVAARLGVDAKKILDRVAPEPPKGTKVVAEFKGAKKPAAKKKGKKAA